MHLTTSFIIFLNKHKTVNNFGLVLCQNVQSTSSSDCIMSNYRDNTRYIRVNIAMKLDCHDTLSS